MNENLVTHSKKYFSCQSCQRQTHTNKFISFLIHNLASWSIYYLLDSHADDEMCKKYILSVDGDANNGVLNSLNYLQYVDVERSEIFS